MEAKLSVLRPEGRLVKAMLKHTHSFAHRIFLLALLGGLTLGLGACKRLDPDDFRWKRSHHSPHIADFQKQFAGWEHLPPVDLPPPLPSKMPDIPRAHQVLYEVERFFDRMAGEIEMNAEFRDFPCDSSLGKADPRFPFWGGLPVFAVLLEGKTQLYGLFDADFNSTLLELPIQTYYVLDILSAVGAPAQGPDAPCGFNEFQVACIGQVEQFTDELAGLHERIHKDSLLLKRVLRWENGLVGTDNGFPQILAEAIRVAEIVEFSSKLGARYRIALHDSPGPAMDLDKRWEADPSLDWISISRMCIGAAAAGKEDSLPLIGLTGPVGFWANVRFQPYLRYASNIYNADFSPYTFLLAALRLNQGPTP